MTKTKEIEKKINKWIREKKRIGVITGGLPQDASDIVRVKYNLMEQFIEDLQDILTAHNKIVDALRSKASGVSSQSSEKLKKELNKMYKYRNNKNPFSLHTVKEAIDKILKEAK